MRSLKTSGGMTRGGGMSAIQRALWLLSMPVTAQYTMKMEENVNIFHETSEQHKGNKYASNARVARDFIDTSKVKDFISKSIFFNQHPGLINIATGEEADKDVNVDEIFTVGSYVLTELENKNVFECKMKRSDGVKTMSTKKHKIKLKDGNVHIDPALLFQRLLVLAKTDYVNIDNMITHELCPYPPAIFESPSMLRKSEKSQLVKAITNYVSKKKDDLLVESNVSSTRYVLDGGSLIYRISSWMKNTTYGEIATRYADFVYSRYGKATVVFDGYGSGPSTKDMTHQRRKSSLRAPVINFTETMLFTSTKESFLSNLSNKQNLINLITEKLQNKGCIVVNSLEDADLNIALTAVQQSSSHTVTVIGEDTDVLILLLYHCYDIKQYDIYYRSDRVGTKKSTTTHDIYLYKEVLGRDICKGLLFMHSFTGCDTTSAFYGVSKTHSFTKFVQDKALQHISCVFSNKDVDHKTVEEAGENAAIILYNGNKCNEINKLRCQLLRKKILNAKSFVEPKQLPPTKSSLKYHSYRSYLQTQKWMNIDHLDAEEWGWEKRDSEYLPRTTDNIAAPEHLLKVIRCNCSFDCSTLRCGCRKMGLNCSSFCGPCQVNDCTNTVVNEHSESESESDDP